MASEIASYLPPFEGLLPKWFLVVSAISLLNTIQAYTTTHFATRMYPFSPSPVPSKPSIPASQVTPLSSRTWGTWTLLTGLVRLYAAYHINEPGMYTLGMWTYGVAWLHYMSEWWVYGTVRWGGPLAGPVVISTGTLVWMGVQRGWYLGQ